ncbi:MAG: carboxypeptidase regulatory-like domain-containing protein, partial [Phaeodactylibacter sp.]|nr:carboxypeptidase regulatory-like domain-containing protein [Phaeodactylibacter sp.]
MKYLSKFFFLLLTAAILVAPGCKDDTVEPPTTVTVSGTVSDDLGNALAGATVTSDAGTTAETAADGTYSIAVSSGAELTYEKEGYDAATATADSENETQTIDVTLNRGPGAFFAAYFTTAGNKVQDPAFAANSIVPTADVAASAGCNASYKGAVEPGATPWYADWSFYDNLINGNTKSNAITTGNLVTITDADLQGAGDVVWTADNTYVLDGFVFVNDGQTLTIQAGTVIQGKPGEGENASALIVARGGKIMADGTKDNPIIFTYEGDAGGSDATLRGQWGGLIILGKAGLNSTPGETAIEGIPTSEARGLYGGSVDNDNSGIVRYVSIRHGGTNIGADNEINGLTLGGVGSGTTLEYIEIIGNKDDGIEWFGGTAEVSYLISAFCGDDGLDYDEGYRGSCEFVIVHQDPAADAADRGGEHDGGTSPETGAPLATPQIYNATYIGRGQSEGTRAITFRDNAGGG